MSNHQNGRSRLGAGQNASNGLVDEKSLRVSVRSLDAQETVSLKVFDTFDGLEETETAKKWPCRLHKIT